jgi:FKBP-type peptidyl-prolyl cis-trans isomerase FkpA
MTKKLLLLFGVSAILLSSSGCLGNGDCKDKTVQSEDQAMRDYASANAMIVAQHSSGMYYQILNPGSGAAPTSSSQVSVKYTGKFTNGTIFDQKLTATSLYPLAGFIPGWQLGLPLIQKGGTIRLIVPSSLAYGCKDSGPIPGNSILFFEIELVDVQ